MNDKKIYRFWLVLALYIVMPVQPFAQLQKEYETHRASIDNTVFPISIQEGDSIEYGAKTMADYTASYLLEKPEDKYFISNRNLLEPLQRTSCEILQATIRDTLKNGKLVEINVKLKPFVEQEHTLRRSVDSTMIYKIDNAIPYGAAYQVPKYEIENISIRIGDKSLLIPKTAYSNFYRVNMCDLNRFFRGVEAYESLNGEYIYLYLFGGSVGDVWFAKLVFDHEKYITRIVSDYYVLELHDSFREEFIGF